jgi:hypothetical protein
MSCCNGARRRPGVPVVRAMALPASAEPADTKGTALRYTGKTPLSVRGPASGRVYSVAPERRQIDATAADCAALLRSGLFVAMA